MSAATKFARTLGSAVLWDIEFPGEFRQKESLEIRSLASTSGENKCCIFATQRFPIATCFAREVYENFESFQENKTSAISEKRGKPQSELADRMLMGGSVAHKFNRRAKKGIRFAIQKNSHINPQPRCATS